jgi:hypothetical protein
MTTVAGQVSSSVPTLRRAYLDRLKVYLVGVIIMGHGLLGYGGIEDAWPYQPYREMKLGETLLSLVVFRGTLFAMGLAGFEAALRASERWYRHGESQGCGRVAPPGS